MRFFPVLVFLAAMFAASPAQAHLDGGADQDVGQYLVDFGWDPESPRAGETTTLAFNLIDNEKAEPVDYDNVWVRIATGDEVAFAGVLRPENTNVTLSFVFPKGGDYTVTARFKAADGSVLAETSFALAVSADGSVPLALAAGIAASVSFGWWFGRRSSQRTATMR